MHVVKRAEPYQLIFPDPIPQVNLRCFALPRFFYPLEFLFCLRLVQWRRTNLHRPNLHRLHVYGYKCLLKC